MRNRTLALFFFGTENKILEWLKPIYHVKEVPDLKVTFYICHLLYCFHIKLIRLMTPFQLLSSFSLFDCYSILSVFFFRWASAHRQNPIKNLSSGDVIKQFSLAILTILFYFLTCFFVVGCRVVWCTDASACAALDSSYCQHLRDEMSSPSSNLVPTYFSV